MMPIDPAPERVVVRKRLPGERASITHKFNIAGHQGHLTVGMYEDGQPGEIFLSMAKGGSTISGLMESFAMAISLALQYGVPLQVLVNKFLNSRFEPAGITKNPAVPHAKSITDYIFRYLAIKFLDSEAQILAGVVVQPAAASEVSLESDATTSEETPLETGSAEASGPFALQEDAPSCADCGSLMVRNGACYKCLNCGSTLGCS